MTIIAAVVAVGLLGALAVLQIALAAGKPWGRLAWGGAHRVLPRRLRAASVASVVLYSLFALLLLSRAGAVPGGGSSVIAVLTWMLLGYFVLGIGMNAISRSRAERWTMTPVCVMLALMTLVIALS